MNSFQTSKKWVVLLAVSLVAMIINIDATAINMALASIGHTFHTSLTTLQWVIGIYLLIGAAFQVFGGRLADIFSHRRIYLLGVWVFIIASLLCSTATSANMLVVARGLQGFGFAFILPLGIAIAISIFPREQRGFIFGLYAMVAGFSQALGPTIGGIILQYFGWRYLFLINVPLGLLSVILLLSFYPVSSGAARGEPLDLSGTCLLSIGLIVFILALNEMSRWGATSLTFFICLFSGVAILVLFYFKSLFSRHPVMDVSLFKNRNYLLICIVRALFMYLWLGIIFMLPLFLQNVLGISPVETGLIMLLMTAVFGGLSPFIGRLLDKIGDILPTAISLLCATISFLLLSFLQREINWWLLSVGLILFGVSSAIMMSSSMITVARNIPEEKRGVGLGTFYTLAFVGATCGVSISGSILEMVSNHHLLAQIKLLGLQLSPSKLIALGRIASGAHSVNYLAVIFPPHQITAFKILVQNSFIKGFSAAMWMGIVLAVLAMLLSLLIEKQSVRGQ